MSAPEHGSEADLLRALLDLVAGLCIPAAVGFVPSDGEAAGIPVSRPADRAASEAVLEGLARLADDEEWVAFDGGFAARVGDASGPLGVLVVVDVASPEHLVDYVNQFPGIRAVVAMAIRSVRTRRSLMLREQRYRMLAEISSDIVYLSDLDQRVTWVAPSVTGLLGWDPGELVGTDMADLLHPDDRRAADEQRAGVHADQDAISRVIGGALIRVRAKGGGYRWFRGSGSAYADESGEIVGVAGSLRDVDDLVRAREESLAERTRLRATMDSLLDPHVYLEAVRDDSGVIVDFVFVDANDAACAFNKLTRPEQIGARLLDILPGHRAGGLLQTYAEIVETGVPYVVDGQSYYNEILGEELLSDVRGIRVGDGLSLTWREVTDRYRTARALAESEERYRTLAENSSDIVYLAGPDRKIRWIAPSVTRALGWTVEELIGREAVDFLYPDDADEILRMREAVYRGQIAPQDARVDGVVARAVTRSGDTRWMVTSNSAMYDEAGNLTAVVGSLRDVDELVRAREEAQAERARLEATVDSLLDPHVYLKAVRDEGARIIDFLYGEANSAACEYLHMRRDELVGASLLDVRPGYAGTEMLGVYADAVETGRPLVLDDFEYPQEARADDRRFDIRAVRVDDGLSLTWRDVTDRFAAQRQVAESEARYRLLADNSTDVIVQMRDGIIAWVSTSIRAVLGWEPDELVGRPALDLIHPDDHARVLAGRVMLNAGRTARRRYRLRSKGGTYHWVDSQGGPMYREDGALDGSVLSIRIVDAEVRAQEALEFRARQDTLTGLANREEAFERLARILGQSPRTGHEVGVLFCDFDDFKNVNDTYGHAGGDQLLRGVSERIRAALRTADLVARIGGDELLVVLDGVHDIGEATSIAEKLRLAAMLPVEIPEGTVSTTMSIGVTLALPGESLDEVIARADAAMYRAKSAGRDQVFAITIAE